MPPPDIQMPPALPFGVTSSTLVWRSVDSL